MKKFKILALLVVIIAAMAAFSGCSKVSVKEVEKAPVDCLTEGMKISLGETALAPVVETKDKAYYNIKVDSGEMSADIGVHLDTKKEQGAVDIDVNSDGQNIEGTLYYADKQIVLQSDMLEDYFDTDAVGLNVDFNYEDFEDSGIYEFLDDYGMMDMGGGALIEQLMGDESIEKMISNYITSMNEMLTENMEFEDIKEEKITIDGKDVSVVSMTMVVDEGMIADLMDSYIDMFGDVSALTGGMYSDSDMEMIIESAKENIPSMDGEYTYYLSKKTGALVKVAADFSVEASEYGDTSTIACDFEITFGSNPAKNFLPCIEGEIKASNDEKITIEAESVNEDGKFEMEGTMAFHSYGDKEEMNFTFECEDGEFELTNEADGEKLTITGEFESSKNEFILKIDLSEAYGGDVYDEYITSIDFSVKYGEDVPKLPEYTNIFDMSADDIEDLLVG